MKVPAQIVSILTVLWLAAAQPGPAQAQNIVTDPLDGSRFTAQIVRDDVSTAASAPLIDTLLFERGEFSSAICTRYNFEPSEYWIRRNGDDVEFLSELNSPTDGRMIWRGIIRDGKLEGTMRWIRERWYRTVDVTHRIRGTIETASTDAAK